MGKYGPERALNEATKMRKKVESGEEENYIEAEHAVAVEENIILDKMDEESRKRVIEINDEITKLDALTQEKKYTADVDADLAKRTQDEDMASLDESLIKAYDKRSGELTAEVGENSFKIEKLLNEKDALLARWKDK